MAQHRAGHSRFHQLGSSTCCYRPLELIVQAQTRIVTIATLSHRSSGQLLHVANTHYDHQSEQARANSSLLIRRLVLDWVKHQERDAGESAQGLVVLMGDLSESTYFSITCYCQKLTDRFAA